MHNINIYVYTFAEIKNKTDFTFIDFKYIKHINAVKYSH